jgi:hypothetical protein
MAYGILHYYLLSTIYYLLSTTEVGGKTGVNPAVTVAAVL